MSSSADSETQPFEQKRFQDVALRKIFLQRALPPPSNPPFPAAGDARGLRAHGWLPLARPHHCAGWNRSAENTAERTRARTTGLPRSRKGGLPHFASVPRGHFAGSGGERRALWKERAAPREMRTAGGERAGGRGGAPLSPHCPVRGRSAARSRGGSLEERGGAVGGGFVPSRARSPTGRAPRPRPAHAPGRDKGVGAGCPPARQWVGAGGCRACARRRGEDTRVRRERWRREGSGVLGMCGFLGGGGLEVGEKG